MQTHTLTLLEQALHYAGEFGWAVMPLHSIAPDGFCTCGNQQCKSEGKHPRTANGLKDATTDADQIDGWWDQWPDANIGIATGEISGIVVLDLDSGKGAQHADLIMGPLGQTVFSTVRVQTGAGMHYYYKYPVGVDIRNSASKLGQFIDIRGNGGYVVAPPSKHVSGAIYTFNGSTTNLLDFPKEWIDKLLAPISPPNGNGTSHNGAQVNGNGNGSGIFVPPPDPGLIVPEEVKTGARNQTLTKLAGLLRHHGCAEDGIYSLLASENQRICKPPLDDKEIHEIARSMNRYAPDDPLNPVADDDAQADYENTLKPYLYQDFRLLTFEQKEILAFHIGKRDIGMIAAATNAGKTTILRNVTMCMAAGREFSPFYDGVRPIKLAYFDFENDEQDVFRDLIMMEKVFTAKEMQRLGENLIVVPKGLMDGELFQFNRKENWVTQLVKKNHIEMVVVDNISAAYDLNDENSASEVTKKIIKPLLKLSFVGQCAFLFAHHYGKGKIDVDTAGVYAGRGSSALQSLSKTVINMFGDVSKGEPVTVECAKRKTDGGQGYSQVFKLKPDRWFYLTTIVPATKKPTTYKAIRKYLERIVYPNTVSTADIIKEFEKDYSEIAIKKTINELLKDGFADKPKHGRYCGMPQDDKEDDLAA